MSLDITLGAIVGSMAAPHFLGTIVTRPDDPAMRDENSYRGGPHAWVRWHATLEPGMALKESLARLVKPPKR